MDEQQTKISKKQYWMILLVIGVIATAVAFVNQRTGSAGKGVEEDVQDRVFTVMGTVAQVKFYGKPHDVEKAANLAQEVFRLVESTCSTFLPESELYKLNQEAFKQPVKCSEMLWQVLLKCREAYKISDGAFDPTVRPLMEVWGFYRKREELPPAPEIAEAMKRVGLDKVVFNDEERTVKFQVEGLGLDLGGIAKGYAVDMAAENVRKLNIKSGIINLGGNIYCFPTPPVNRKFYAVSIRNPLDKEKSCGVIRILNKSVATSGNYERYVTFGGRNYTHIVNPKTGMPVEDMLSVTVLTSRAVDADLLSTSIFAGGLPMADKLYRELPDTQFLVMIRSAEGQEGFDIHKYGDAWDSVNHSGK